MIRWKIAKFNGANAETVYREITAIGETYTPADIVAKARDEKTELHKCFDWNDTSAASKYRLIQAQQIMVNLVVISEPAKDHPEAEPLKFRAIVNTNERSGAYTTIKATVTNDDAYARLLAQAKHDAEVFKQRYKMLRELDSIMEAIDSFLE